MSLLYFIFKRIKLLCILFIIILFTVTFIIIDAHSGGTDSKGGHRDSSTGTYHYHHGYPAHQHTDGICPYDYDDNTSKSSSVSSNTNTGKTSTTVKNTDSNSHVWIAFITVLFSILFVYLVCRINDYLIKKMDRKHLNELQENVCEAHSPNMDSKGNKERLFDIYLKLIEHYESECDSNSNVPSCIPDMQKWLERRSSSAQEEIAKWDKSTDYIKIAHSLLSHATFDLLTSGKYHIYRGTLNPMSCASHLLHIHNKAMEYAVKIGEITEHESCNETLYLKECIAEVG